MGLPYLLYKALKNILHFIHSKKVFRSYTHTPKRSSTVRTLLEASNYRTHQSRKHSGAYTWAEFYCNLGKRGTTAEKNFFFRTILFFASQVNPIFTTKFSIFFKSGEAVARFFPLSRRGVGGMGTCWCLLKCGKCVLVRACVCLGGVLCVSKWLFELDERWLMKHLCFVYFFLFLSLSIPI